MQNMALERKARLMAQLDYAANQHNLDPVAKCAIQRIAGSAMDAGKSAATTYQVGLKTLKIIAVATLLTLPAAGHCAETCGEPLAKLVSQ